ncbi:MAG: Uma2 family endonuclease [Desulfobacteraceae bacterium]|nr:Uma2 family endonuclease [Desulfobacteraceae bacterium]
MEDPEKPRGTFSVPEEGVKPFFVLEMVSPKYRKPDTVDKPVIYRKAGVSEYIIADPGLKKNKIPGNQDHRSMYNSDGQFCLVYEERTAVYYLL